MDLTINQLALNMNLSSSLVLYITITYKDYSPNCTPTKLCLQANWTINIIDNILDMHI